MNSKIKCAKNIKNFTRRLKENMMNMLLAMQTNLKNI